MLNNQFDYFVIFAEMRTGSNFLESNLNAFDDFLSHGEAFNPEFVGYPNKSEVLGMDLAAREQDPLKLLNAIRGEPEVLAGFRFFYDHDARILPECLSDPRCAKIILTRNPVESYVSLKIAQATGQWKLTNIKRRRDAKIDFDEDEYCHHVETQRHFQLLVTNQLQKSGQTAFFVAYEDLNDVDVINGLAKFLGTDQVIDQLEQSLKP